MDLHLGIHSRYVILLEHSKSMNIAEIESYNNNPGTTTEIQWVRNTYLNWLLYLPRANYIIQPNCVTHTSSSLVWITNAKSYQSELKQLYIIQLYQALGCQMRTSMNYSNKLFSIEQVSTDTFPTQTSLLHTKENAQQLSSFTSKKMLMTLLLRKFYQHLIFTYKAPER